MKHAVAIDPGGNRTCTGIHQITSTARKAVQIGDFNIIAQSDVGRVQVQQRGQRLRQAGPIAAKTGQARMHMGRLADGQHGLAQGGKGGVQRGAARIAAHLQGRQAVHRAAGNDGAVTIR